MNQPNFAENALQACIAACTLCHQFCLQTAIADDSKLGYQESDSGHHWLLTSCAEICEACALDCEAIGGMGECAETCRHCAERCREIASIRHDTKTEHQLDHAPDFNDWLFVATESWLNTVQVSPALNS